MCILQLLFVLPAFARPQDSKTLQFDLHPADGPDLTGPIEKISEGWTITMGSPQSTMVKGTDVVGLRRHEASLPAFPIEEHVALTNGDRLPGFIHRLVGERLRLQARIGPGQDLVVPLEIVSYVWLSAPDNVEDVEAFRRQLTTERRRRDRLLLRNGDTVEGTLAALDEKSIRMDVVGGKSMSVDREKAALLALNTELARVPWARGPYARLILANGGRLSITTGHTEDQVLAGTMRSGVAVRVPLEKIAAIDIFQARAVYLSDLKPRRYEHTSYLGLSWPFALDASIARRDLRLAGSVYDKGLGLHSECRVTYELPEEYDWFEALVGLDEQTGRQGSVRIQILLDGKPLSIGPDKELTGRDPPLPIRLSVAGGKELTLVVRFGRYGDICDHVNWANARLIRRRNSDRLK